MADPKAKQAEAVQRRFTGTVVSDKADKTVTVAVERRVRHPLYGKAYFVTRKFHAHDEENAAKTGDTVTIEASRPRSAKKRWVVVGVESAGKEPAGKPEEAK